MHTAQQLYHLQEIDLERDKRHHRLKEILGQLGEPRELRDARAAVERLQAQLAEQHTRQKGLELETQSLDAKIASVDERLYSGRVTNPKELSDLQKDAAALRKRRSVLDEKSLEIMIDAEESQAALSEMQAKRDSFEAAWAAQHRHLLQEQTDLKAQLARLNQIRADHAQTIAATALAQYEALRRSKNGIAVVSVEDGFCAMCGVELSDRKLAQTLQSDELVFCGNCNRILAG
jgi:hypothetical protein